MDEDDWIDTNNILKFFDDYQNHNLKKHLKSDPIPIFQTSIVQEVVARNTYEVVFDHHNDVLLAIYSKSNCKYCDIVKTNPD